MGQIWNHQEFRTQKERLPGTENTSVASLPKNPTQVAVLALSSGLFHFKNSIISTLTAVLFWNGTHLAYVYV